MIFATGGGLACFAKCSVTLPNAPPQPPPPRHCSPTSQDKAAREAHKAERARLALAGDNFIAGEDDDDDPFSGMTPGEIQAYVATSTAGATRDDPFEGMTPDEINEYMSRHGKTSIE